MLRKVAQASWVKVLCGHQDFKDCLELQWEGESGFSGETQLGVIWVAVEIDLNMEGRVKRMRRGAVQRALRPVGVTRLKPSSYFLQ